MPERRRELVRLFGLAWVGIEVFIVGLLVAELVNLRRSQARDRRQREEEAKQASQDDAPHS